MHIFIVSDGYHQFETSIQTYIKRLGKIVKIIPIKPQKHADIKTIVKKETLAIATVLKKYPYPTYLLDEYGTSFTSLEFLEEIQKKQQHQGKHINFVIGGAYGVDREILQEFRCSLISMGTYTLPHTLALLVLLEQLYRIDQIKKNTSYHHGDVDCRKK